MEHVPLWGAEHSRRARFLYRRCRQKPELPQWRGDHVADFASTSSKAASMARLAVLAIGMPQ